MIPNKRMVRAVRDERRKIQLGFTVAAASRANAGMIGDSVQPTGGEMPCQRLRLQYLAEQSYFRLRAATLPRQHAKAD